MEPGEQRESGGITVGRIYRWSFRKLPVVYTQESGANKVLASSANAALAAKVLANPADYSRLGSEVYGGYVTGLTGATVESSKAQLSTYSNPGNLANLVSPTAVNLSKAALPDISAPWSISGSSPAVQELSVSGLTGINFGGSTTTFKTTTQIGASEPATVMKTSGEGASVLQPSGFDLWAMGLNIPVVSGALVATSDFLLSGTNPIAGAAKTASSLSGKGDIFSRYNIETSTGTGVPSTAVTTPGTPVITYKALEGGGYEAITETPSTTTQSIATTTTQKYVPVMGGFEVGST